MRAEEAKRRLLWRARRGLLELDLLLMPFIENNYNSMNEEEKEALARLLELPDQTLQSLVYGQQGAPDAALAHVLDRLRQPAPP